MYFICIVLYSGLHGTRWVGPSIRLGIRTTHIGDQLSTLGTGGALALEPRAGERQNILVRIARCGMWGKSLKRSPSRPPCTVLFCVLVFGRRGKSGGSR